MKVTIKRSGFTACALNMNYTLRAESGETIAEGVSKSTSPVELSVGTQPMTLRIWQKQAGKVVEKEVDIRAAAGCDNVVATIKISMMKLALFFPIIGLFKPTFSIDVAVEYKQ